MILSRKKSIIILTSNSVDQTIGQVIIGLSSASKTAKGLGVTGWFIVLGRALELIRASFQVFATLLNKKKHSVFRCQS